MKLPNEAQKLPNEAEILPNEAESLPNEAKSLPIEQKSAYFDKYFCAKCNYYTNKKSNYDRHLGSKRHLDLKKSKKERKLYICKFCDKKYKSYKGLWGHSKKCKKVVTESKDDYVKLLEKHTQLQQKLIEQQTQFIEQKHGNIINNTGNTINNTQNISVNVFLNEYCKDAMNLTDFVDNLKVTLEDMHRTNQLGLADGITNIFMEGLNDLSVVERPIHCVDKKRGKFYIKDNDKWGKDNNDKIGSAMHNVKIKHIHKLKEWEEKHPNFKIPGHPNNKPWSKLVDTITKEVEIKEQKRLLKKIRDSVSIKDAWESLEELRSKS